MGKAVLFGLWGGVVIPHPHETFCKSETSLNLSRDFISNIIANTGTENALFRAERGNITLSQMLKELDSECQKEDGSFQNKQKFSAQKLFDEVKHVKFDGKVLNAAATLKKHGIATCVLANIWVDDTSQRSSTAQILSVLESHFDLVVRSCDAGTRLPETAMFQTALNKLDIKVNQALWLDVSEESVQAAESLGMTAAKITDVSQALKEIENFTGIQVTGEQNPRSCNPDEVSHGYVTVKPGVKIHFVEMGEGPPVLLCHGFPESWFSWRYQISALASAGFRAIALDLKGFGDSSAPAEIEEYSQEKILQELLVFLDKLGLAQVTFLGHDWGGAIAWNMALFYPERLRAVASLNTPLSIVDPDKDPLERAKAIPIFDYQIYFQEPGVAEAELEKNLERTFKLLFTASNETETHPQVNTAGVRKRGGLLVGMPEEVPRSSILSEADLQYYVQQYKKSGFRGPLNLYRNMKANWQWMSTRPRGQILMPALMVTAGKDKVLLPSFTTGMEKMVPNLTRGHIENCGHWTQMERPNEVNQILISWLKEIHQKERISFSPKL